LHSIADENDPGAAPFLKKQTMQNQMIFQSNRRFKATDCVDQA
jgi:hypothetical protein